MLGMGVLSNAQKDMCIYIIYHIQYLYIYNYIYTYYYINIKLKKKQHKKHTRNTNTTGIYRNLQDSTDACVKASVPKTLTHVAQEPLHLIQEGRVPFEVRTTSHWPDGDSDGCSMGCSMLLVNWCELRCKLREFEWFTQMLLDHLSVFTSRSLLPRMKPTFPEIRVCLQTGAKSASKMNYSCCMLLLFLSQ